MRYCHKRAVNVDIKWRYGWGWNTSATMEQMGQIDFLSSTVFYNNNNLSNYLENQYNHFIVNKIKIVLNNISIVKKESWETRQPSGTPSMPHHSNILVNNMRDDIKLTYWFIRNGENQGVPPLNDESEYIRKKSLKAPNSLVINYYPRCRKRISTKGDATRWQLSDLINQMDSPDGKNARLYIGLSPTTDAPPTAGNNNQFLEYNIQGRCYIYTYVTFSSRHYKQMD